MVISLYPGSGASDYVGVQIRSRENGKSIHVQGAGESTNRNYGVAVDVPADDKFVSWLNNQPHVFNSLYGSDRKYVPAQVAIRDGNLHFQVQGSTFNRSYGAVLDVSCCTAESLHEFIALNENSDDEDDDGCCVDDTCCR